MADRHQKRRGVYKTIPGSNYQATEDTAAQTFRKLILKWKINDVRKPRLLRSDVLPKALHYSESRRYYQNFIPLILEETRSILEQGLEAENKANIFNVRVIRMRGGNPSFLASLELQGRLPTGVEQAKTSMVLKLTYHGANGLNFSMLCFADVKEQNKILGKIDLVDQVDFYNTCSYEHFIEENPESFARDSRWSAVVLGSVLSQMRMYVACYDPPEPIFISQVVSGRLQSTRAHGEGRLPTLSAGELVALQAFMQLEFASQKIIQDFYKLPVESQELFPVYCSLAKPEQLMIRTFLTLPYREQAFIGMFYQLPEKEQGMVKTFCRVNLAEQQLISRFSTLDALAEQAIKALHATQVFNKEIVQRFFFLDPKEQGLIYLFHQLTVEHKNIVREFFEFSSPKQQVMHNFYVLAPLVQEIIKTIITEPAPMQNAMQYFVGQNPLTCKAIEEFSLLSALEMEVVKSFYSLSDLERADVNKYHELTVARQQVTKKASRLSEKIWQCITGDLSSEKEIERLTGLIIMLRERFNQNQQRAVEIFYGLPRERQEAINTYIALPMFAKAAIIRFTELELAQQRTLKRIYRLEQFEQNAVKRFLQLEPALQNDLKSFYQLDPIKQKLIKDFYVLELEGQNQIVMRDLLILEDPQKEAIVLYYKLRHPQQIAVQNFSNLEKWAQDIIFNFYTLNELEQNAIKAFYAVENNHRILSMLEFCEQRVGRYFYVLNPRIQQINQAFSTYTSTELKTINDLLAHSTREQQIIRDYALLTPLQQSVYKEFYKLNSQQQIAIRDFEALDHGMQVLQGPPGTGKTSLIVALLHVLCVQNKKVLVCAPSNKAVQVIAERFLEKHPGNRIALIGVESKLKETLQPIFTQNWSANKCSIIDKCTDVFERQLSQGRSILPQGIMHELKTLINSIHHTTRIFLTSLVALNEACKRTIDQLQLQRIVVLLVKLKQEILVAAKYDPKQCGSRLEIELLNYAQVIFATLSTSGRRIFENILSPEILIIDEGSQAVEAETLIPFAMQPKKCLLVGDTKQLPATVISKVASEYNYNWSMMWRLVEECGHSCTMLTVQYRMDPSIRRWPSLQYYGDQLTDGPLIAARDPSVSDYGAYAFINVNSREKSKNYSCYNPQECQQIIIILNELKTKNVNLREQVGIITFYAAQVEHMQREFAKHPWLQEVKVHTVDSYQGNENDYIIISFVRSNQGGGVGFLRDFRRLNVAITRARLSLIMVGNASTLSRHKEKDVAKLVADAWERNCIFDALPTTEREERIFAPAEAQIPPQVQLITAYQQHQAASQELRSAVIKSAEKKWAGRRSKTHTAKKRQWVNKG